MTYFCHPRIRDVKEPIQRKGANLLLGGVQFYFAFFSCISRLTCCFHEAVSRIQPGFCVCSPTAIWVTICVPEKSRHIFASSLPRERKRLWLAVRLWSLEAGGLDGQTCLDLFQKRTGSHPVCYCTSLLRKNEIVFLRCACRWKKSVVWKGYLSLQCILASLYGSWCPELWCIFLSSNGYS